MPSLFGDPVQNKYMHVWINSPQITIDVICSARLIVDVNWSLYPPLQSFMDVHPRVVWLEFNFPWSIKYHHIVLLYYYPFWAVAQSSML